MRILYVTADIPWPPHFGGAIRRWNVLQGLIAAGSTDVLVFRKPDVPINSNAFRDCNRIVDVSREHLQFLNSARRLYGSTVGRAWLTVSSPKPYEYRGDNLRTLRSQLSAMLDFGEYDLVWFNTARTAMAVGEIKTNATVLDGDDFDYIREYLLLSCTPSYGAKVFDYLNVAKLWWWERCWARRFTYVVRCSTEDRDRHPSRNCGVIANGTDIPAVAERTPEARVLFVGHLAYPPNVEGLKWFLGSVWPKIRQRMPEAVFDVVGKEPPALVKAHDGQDGVLVHGFVEDLRKMYKLASVSVAPLLAGGGTRLKILESLAHAVPVVSTPVGAFGLEARAEHGLDRASSPHDFAVKCLAHLSDPHSEQSRATAGRSFVSSRYDWKVIQGHISHLARQVVAESRRKRRMIHGVR